MDKPPLLLSDIAFFLHEFFQTTLFPTDERGGVYRPSNRLIHHIGLALEPSANTANWVRSERLDALWLHRPWQLNLASIPTDVGVVTHHLPFDEYLTVGYNIWLAKALGISRLEEIGYKQGTDKSGTLLPKRPIGMIGQFDGNVPERSFQEWLDLIEKEFGGYDRAEQGQLQPQGRIAVVGAMNAGLLHEAHERGVSLYLTGEYRKGAQAAVDETGMAVIAIGHRRSEEWGLRALRSVLLEQFAGLAVVLG
ncbi:Nif3-like dinuclear metal center hexameric protein [Fibrella forsythiae]|uniref:Nif3-like dinuclear metal center hexameric protein n=1 Tax=Fibrella forsythiae TaxID=2817061 RepID=A0ABS3JN86_9BACT|nr:Nif3-like dinuclear metal center hexameric protein [Fibrella forsythiae]MBO0951474.1 Nif3-like dinuclear metal center hexameric protein [Fibrella forsythiae]